MIVNGAPLKQGPCLKLIPWPKWPPFWQTTFFNCIFLNESGKIPIQISLKCVPRSPIDNKPVLVQVMAWRRTGAKPLPEPIIPVHYAYMRHQGKIWVDISWSIRPGSEWAQSWQHRANFGPFLLRYVMFTGYRWSSVCKTWNSFAINLWSYIFISLVHWQSGVYIG